MVQEAENYREEDEANASKDEVENGLENVEKFENDASYATSEDSAKRTGKFHRPSVEMLTIAVCATCGPHGKCVDAVQVAELRL